VINLELTEDEARHLKASVEAALIELRREIARTDHREFRDLLREREDALTRVADRIPAPAAV
jgi:predicted secreted protein